jgi:hypothetical protein
MNRSLLLVLPVAILFSACAGDVHTTRQSPAQPSRHVPSSRPGSDTIRRGPTKRYERTRIYEITQVESADKPRGQWRALGETIEVRQGTLSFVAIGDGRTVTLDAPYQITPTPSHSDRAPTQLNTDNPNPDVAPSGPARAQ